MFALLVLPPLAHAQDSTKLINGTDGSVFKHDPRDTSAISDKKLAPTEFTGTYSSCNIGLGYIHDFVAYQESSKFKQQMDSAGFNLKPEVKLRDFRILVSGVLKTKRYIAWKFGFPYMWDGDYDQWLVRESGVTIGAPELAGNFFIGRTKEGFSMVKVMNGHSPWTRGKTNGPGCHSHSGGRD